MGGSVSLSFDAARVFRRQEKVQAVVEADVEKRAYQGKSRMNQVNVAAAQNFQLTRKVLE